MQGSRAADLSACRHLEKSQRMLLEHETTTEGSHVLPAANAFKEKCNDGAVKDGDKSLCFGGEGSIALDDSREGIGDQTDGRSGEW